MPASGPLSGVRVVVAGAGLAGLTAARALIRKGAVVRIVEARQRLGGRVWTWREDPLSPFHAELGGELIDKDHKEIRTLCRDLDLRLVRVLRRGFGLAIEQGGRIRVLTRQTDVWSAFSDSLEPAAETFDAAGRKWTSTAAAVIARRSLREMLDAAHATVRVHAMATALRGFYVADPEDLSALVAVEQTLDDDDPSRVPMYRIEAGTDALVHALHQDAKATVDLGHVVRAVQQDKRGVAITVERPNGRRSQLRADYLIAAVPAPLLLEWKFSPPLPEPQQRAFVSLRYGMATKALVRYATRWWRRPGRPRAFSSNLPIGALWEAAEEQRKAPILAFLAGGKASAELAGILAREGADGLTRRLRWIGGGTRETAAVQAVRWEQESWSRGAYGYFSPGFDPALRDLLRRGHERVLFAGSDTSRDYQGYMNGAVESGLRVADELVNLQTLRALTS